VSIGGGSGVSVSVGGGSGVSVSVGGGSGVSVSVGGFGVKVKVEGIREGVRDGI